MAGFLTLLETWIYEHFPTLGRPQPNADYCAGHPYAMRWAQQAHGAVSEDAVRAYRVQLDTLRPEDVVWDPYVRLRDGGERPEVTFYEAWVCSPDYLQWYQSISHPRVQPEATAPVVDPPLTLSPWDGIQSAIGYLDPVLTRWRAHDQDLSLPYVMSQVEEAFEALHFRTTRDTLS
ncbi:hypothetical protein C2S51_000587 [Perilla frutescens var. frutescens]|nr:hypothetical protein C2S51_000587 [Perilla frutescens var. frutescens]